MSDATYTYFPYARSGLSNAIDGPPTTGQRQVVSFEIAVNGANLSPSVDALLYGPGDVTRLDAGQIVRTDPPPDSTNHSPDYFPLIEFARPELPWAFTPVPVTETASSGSNSGAQLQPWLALIVVPATTELTIDPTGASLPVLKVVEPATLATLPALDGAWAWAHVQAVGTIPDPNDSSSVSAQLQQAFDTQPETVISRLLCATPLEAQQPYLACVVPRYNDGVLVGLGQSPELDPSKLAWDANPQNPVSLPVYYYWSFTTGADGTFQSLAEKLRPLQSPTQIGSRPMDASDPGAALPGVNGMGLQGTMCGSPPDLGSAPPTSFERSLAALLDEPAGGSGAGQWVLAPPIYGRWPARVDSVPAPPRVPGRGRHQGWLAALNLDLRNRAAAEFGALVVRRQVDALMASAWKQLGDLQRANEALRQAQLARAGGDSIYSGRLVPRSAAALLALTGPVQARIALPAADRTTDCATVSAALATSALGTDAVGPALRRLVRPAGPLARRFDPTGALRIDALIEALAADDSALVPPRTAPNGTQTSASISTLSATTITSSASTSSSTATSIGAKGEVQQITVQWSTLSAAAGRQQSSVQTLLGQSDPSAPPATDLSGLAADVLAGLQPENTVPARMLPRLTGVDPNWRPSDPLEPILAAPQFPTPLWQSLRAVSQQLIAPGLEAIPPETITVLQTNSTFVNSFMVGANHELARQLLWRHFPTDQRGTYFHNFWDASAAVTGPLPGVADIDQWPAADALNVAAQDNADGLLVLIVRGELLRRFPNTSVYAISSDGSTPPNPQFNDPNASEQYPCFQGQLQPDISFFGFEIESSAAASWFFVLQEHPTEPRFGPPDQGTLTVGPDAATTASNALRDPYRVALWAEALVNPS